MAQTGYTPILIYSSSTTTNTPAAGSLTNSTLGSELAINITDGKLFYKDNANAVQVIGWKTTPATAGGTGQTAYTAGDLLYASSTTALSKLAIGANTTILTSSGTAPQWSAASGITVGTATNIAGGAAGSVPYQTGAGATSLLAIGTAYYQLGVNAGGTAPAWQPSATSVLTAQGDLLYASAANTLARLAKNTTATRYLANTGTNNNPAWAQVDLTNGVTGTLPAGNGGTGVTSFGGTNTLLYTTATSTLSSIATANTSTLVTNSSGVPSWTSGGTANRVLRTNGTAVSFAQVDLSTDVTGVLPVANSLLYYNTGEKTMSSGSNYDWYSIDFGNYSGRSCRIEVVFSLVSGGGGSRIWYRNSLVLETGGASLSENNLNAVNGVNGSLSFVLSGATLTVRTTTSATSETARMAILVEGRDMTSARISVL